MGCPVPEVSLNGWDARAAAHSVYGFTDLPTVHDRSTIVVTHGKGPHNYDTNGRKYLDANSGLRNMVWLQALTTPA